MKRLLALLVIFAFSFSMAACDKSTAVDFDNVTDFEAALKSGDDLTGKTVTFTVGEVNPDSAFGYNLQAGEHLNFCSSENPNLKSGDTITVEVEEVKSVLGSYIIYYKKVN